MNENNLKNKPIDNASDRVNDNSGFILGIISAVLLIVCISVLLLFNNKQVQRIITKKINIDAIKKPSDIESLLINSNNSVEPKKASTLLGEKSLNVSTEHPNGTVGRLTNISFTKENTIVEMVVTNGFLFAIYLNLHRKGVVLVDNLGNKFNLKPPVDNPYLEIESGTTFAGKLVFKGGVTSKADNLTLITNNQIGSDQPFSRRPKMKFFIPLQQ